jgi:hypothetical protein
MNRTLATRLLEEVMRELKRTHPEMRVDTVSELFEVGELRVGLEILCDNLLEQAEPLSPRAKEDIARVAALLGMSERSWRGLASR